jgi:hypothetical protein
MKTMTTIGSGLRLLVLATSAVAFLGPTRADAAEDAGRWFDHRHTGNPVLSPEGGSAGIDATGTAWGYFLTNGPNDYRMYYTGIDPSGGGRDYDICLVTSTDRIHWKRITNGINGTHKVIDDGMCWAGPPWKEGSTYHMLYKKVDSGYKWRHVTSADGISWGSPTKCTGTIGAEISALMKIGNTYHAWGSGGAPAKPYHFTSRNLTAWTVQNGGKPLFPIAGKNVICPDVFYNVDTSRYYAVAAVTPGDDRTDPYNTCYGTFRMWAADDADFQKNAVALGDVLIGNAKTMPLVPDWEKGCNYDGQHFLWPGMFGRVRNSDPLFFYYSAQHTLDDGYTFSVGLISYPTVGEAIAAAEAKP